MVVIVRDKDVPIANIHHARKTILIFILGLLTPKMIWTDQAHIQWTTDLIHVWPM